MGTRFRAGVVSILALSAAGGARGDFLVFDRDSEVWGRFTVAAEGSVRIGPRASVEGSVHSNRRVHVLARSLVTGDVSATGTVRSQGRILGTASERGRPLELPRAPAREEALALAQRVLRGDVTLADEAIDEVLFVDGNVRMVGSLRGRGTLVATGSVWVAGDRRRRGIHEDGSHRLSILSYGDIVVGGRRSLRGVLRARGKVVLHRESWVEGAVVANGGVTVGLGANVVADPLLLDLQPPALTLLLPEAPFVTQTAELEFGVLYTDDGSGIDAASLAVFVDGEELGDRCSGGESGAACSAVLPGSGETRIAAAVSDRADNRVEVADALTVVLDSSAPVLEILTPSDGTLTAEETITVHGSVSDDGVVTLLSVNGAAVAAPGGSFSRQVVLVEGANPLTMLARDSTGKQTEQLRTVILDRQPPRLLLRRPLGRVIETNRSSIELEGEVEDENELVSLEIGGVEVDPVENVFAHRVALQEGENQVVIRASDAAGNTSRLDLEVHRFSVPAVEIHSPAHGSLVSVETIDVVGEVSDPKATVIVNGVAAQLSGTSYVAAGVEIRPGANLVKAVATTPSGRRGAASVTLQRDVTPPRIVIHAPKDGAVLFEPSVSVLGLVNDIVVGTVNAPQVEVTVNGMRAQVIDRRFFVPALALREGVNEILARAVDASGNRAEARVRVRFEEAPGPWISVSGGDHQQGRVGEVLAEGLSVVVRDELRGALAGRTVVFQADGNDGAFDDGSRRIAVVTDTAGSATTRFALGRRAGYQTVRASVAGVAGEARFTLQALPGPPSLLVVDAGDQQVGTAGQRLPEPLAVVVTDDAFNRLEGVPVALEVMRGGGRLGDGLSRLQLRSDSDGRVAVAFTLGPEEGTGNNVVRARLLDAAGDRAVSFAASGRVAREASATSVSGVVLDNSEVPVPGVGVKIDGTDLETRTDAAGVFHLHGAPVGILHLLIDASTAERPGQWPDLEFLLSAVAGQESSLGRPIYMLPLTTEDTLFVDEEKGGVLTLTEVPGFALEVAAGSVTFPGGSRSGIVSVTPVHGDKVPMAPNFGQQPRLAVTIQPAGARFDPPAALSLPNLDGLAPGQVTELYSFDHDLFRFVGIGPATVSDDGTTIRSDPGVGVLKAGWHSGGDPLQPGTCHDCGPCRDAVDGACIADEDAVPPQAAPDDCRMERCEEGELVSEASDRERPPQIEGNCYDERCPRPEKRLDLDDAPLPRRCCGDPLFGLPEGYLAGIYDPAEECCVLQGRLLTRKKPLLTNLDLCPDRFRASLEEAPYEYTGCSISPIVSAALGFGHPDNPARGETTAFSDARLGDATHRLPCDIHDECYQMCLTTEAERLSCDDAFRDGMLAVCNAALQNEPADEDDPSHVLSIAHRCFVAADTYYTGVRILGYFRGWVPQQKRVCQCCA